MLRAISIFAVAALVSGGLSVVGHSHATSTVSGSGDDDRLMRAFAQVRIGMPAVQLAALGFNTARAEHLSKAVLKDHFMPKDKITFAALDPAVRNCYMGLSDCSAYIFDIYTEQSVLLVQGGRVTWKMMSQSVVAGGALPLTFE